MKVSALFFSFILIAAMMITAHVTRPLMPIDETRYLTVAWEYLTRGNWILPTLNFEAYSHKPPFLFWMIDGLWTVTGDTGLWAARLVSFLAACTTLFFTYRTARALWPDDKDTADITLYLMIAMPFFLLYSTLVMFDTLLTSAVMIGIYASVKFYTAQKKRYIALLAFSFGLGGLIKGPVILLHLLPVLILFPIIHRPLSMPRMVWFMAAAAGVLGGAAITLAWAIPAAIVGGTDYAHMIFWGQSAGRMVSAFDHARPFWFYLILLPVLMMPWIFIWPFYHRGSPEKQMSCQNNWSIGFLLCWAVPVFLAFLAISGKQVHYLLPLLPAVMMGISHWIVRTDKMRSIRPLSLYLYAVFPLMVLLLGLSFFEFYVDILDTHWADSFAVQIRDTNPIPVTMSFFTVFGLGIWLRQRGSIHRPIRTFRVIGTAIVIMIIGLHAAAAPLLQKYYDLSPIAGHLTRIHKEGRPIAAMNKWEGELGYLSRLTGPVDIVQETEIAAWLRTHPNGVVIYRSKKDTPLPRGTTILSTQPYRSPERVMTLLERQRK